MADAMRIRFEGGRETARALRALPRLVATEVLETAVVAGAGIVRRRAAELAPRPAVRRRPRSLRLADSIKVTVTEKDRAHTVVHVGTAVPYAHLVEFGHEIVARGPTRERVSITTVRISKRTGKQVVSSRFGLDPVARLRLRARRTAGSTGFVQARPFMRPAFDETKEAVVQRMAEVVGKGIEQAMRRLMEGAPARVRAA